MQLNEEMNLAAKDKGTERFTSAVNKLVTICQSFVTIDKMAEGINNSGFGNLAQQMVQPPALSNDNVNAAQSTGQVTGDKLGLQPQPADEPSDIGSAAAGAAQS